MTLTKNIIDQRIAEYSQHLLEHNPKAREPWATVDLGNSNPHSAIFKEGMIDEVIRLPLPFNPKRVPVENWVASNVTHAKVPKKNRIDNLRKKNMFLDMPIDYAMTLGQDRLYQAYYVHKLFPKENIALIDVGTFLKIDFIGPEGFKGGFIFPGLKTFLYAYGRGQQLPNNVDIPTELDPKNPVMPHKTNDAISEAAKLFIQGSVKETLLMFPGHSPIMTGGQGNLAAMALETETNYSELIHLSLFAIANRIIS